MSAVTLCFIQALGNIGETSDRRGGWSAWIMGGFPERLDSTLKWTELNWGFLCLNKLNGTRVNKFPDLGLVSPSEDQASHARCWLRGRSTVTGDVFAADAGWLGNTSSPSGFGGGIWSVGCIVSNGCLHPVGFLGNGPFTRTFNYMKIRIHLTKHLQKNGSHRIFFLRLQNHVCQRVLTAFSSMSDVSVNRVSVLIYLHLSVLLLLLLLIAVLLSLWFSSSTANSSTMTRQNPGRNAPPSDFCQLRYQIRLN